MPASEYARQLTGLSVNLIVRDVLLSMPFFTEVLGLKALYSDPDFAALEGPESSHIMLHADHTFDRFPGEVTRLAVEGKTGTGAEIRIFGLDPDEVERRARQRGFKVNVPTQAFQHGWRECRLEDSNGYMFAVGILPPP